MVWQRTFSGTAELAHDARTFVGFLLTGLEQRDDVVQAAGELIANALTHTQSGMPGGLYGVEVRRWNGGAAITVTDQGGPGEPQVFTGELGEHGYGLLTVQALASWWDWSGNEQSRTVTAVFSRSHP